MLFRVVLVGVLALVVGLGTFVGGLLAAPVDFAVPPPPKSALLLAADGRQFATIPPPERREVVTAQDIPLVMRQAIIAAEDERFLRHKGIDPLATIRAVFRDLTGGIAQGGSTLTQQYVKNVYVGNERTALRKVREAALAVRLERTLSKQEILTDYLNALYLGNGLYGVQAASKYYFGVAVKDLDLDEKQHRRDPSLALARASMLAGIAPAPSAWNPVKDFTTARSRQQYTLNRMVVGGDATPQQVSDAYQLDVRPLRESPPEPVTVAPEFTDFVKGRLKERYSGDEDAFFRGGLRVRTTLDLDLQAAVTQALREVLPDRRDPQAAVVAIDYRNGDVKAMATLRRVPERVDSDGKVVRAAVDGYAQNVGFNLATNAQRSSGSTIKPFTLAQALIEGKRLDERRYGPAKDSIPNPGANPNPYVYGNSADGEAGTFTLREALARSVNTIYLPLAVEVGRDKVAALATQAGLRGSIAPGNLSFGIGAGVEVTPLSEANAYGTFANSGVRVPPRYYTEIRTGGSGTDPGLVFDRAPAPKGTRVMPSQVAGQVVQAMTDVVTGGTYAADPQPFPFFGKTGTTDDSTDAWWVGCIPGQHLCISTWMGYEDIVCRNPATGTHVVAGSCGGMKGVHGVDQVFGGTLPAKIFARSQEILRQLQADRAQAAAGGSPSPTPSPALSSGPTAIAPPPPRRRRRAVPPRATPTATAAARPAGVTPTSVSSTAPRASRPPPVVSPAG